MGISMTKVLSPRKKGNHIYSWFMDLELLWVERKVYALYM